MEASTYLSRTELYHQRKIEYNDNDDAGDSIDDSDNENESD